MIHYVASSSTGSVLRFAFQGSVHVQREAELALVRGADMARRINGTGGGHNIHGGGEHPCRCEENGQITWSEPVGTVWEKRGFRWYPGTFLTEFIDKNMRILGGSARVNAAERTGRIRARFSRSLTPRHTYFR